MYENHFGLKFRPFSATPDSRMLYQTPVLTETIDTLEKTLRLGDGIGMLTAAAGTGKTLVCKVLHERLAENPLSVLLLNSAYATRSSLLQAILFEMGQSYQRMTEQELRLELVTSGRKIAETQTGIALLVDEAHLLGEHILEELRGLTNFVLQGRPIFRVLLAGQYALEDLLAKKSMESFNQRLKCQLTLDLLSRQESLEYIMTRVQMAGGELLEIFSEPALELIVHAADGLPRCLNQLCDHACVLATLNERSVVEPVDVREALDDLQKLPLHWNISLPTADPLTELRGELKSTVVEPDPVASTSDDKTATAESEWDFSEKTSVTKAETQQSQQNSPAESEQVKVPQAAFVEIGGDDEPSFEKKESIEIDAPFLASAEKPLELNSAETLAESSQEEQKAAAIAMDKLLLQDNLDEQMADFASELEEDCRQKVEHQLAVKSVVDIQNEVEAAFEQPALANMAIHSVETDEPLEAEDKLTVVSSAAHQKNMAELAIVNIKDHYAELDARRRGQIWSYDSKTESIDWPVAAACATTSQLPEPEIEEQIGQAVAELYEEVQTAISVSDQDAVPAPEQFLKTWADSRAAGNDLVEPEEETEYDQLYTRLRKKA